MARKAFSIVLVLSVLVIVFTGLAFVACSGLTKPLDDAFELPEQVGVTKSALNPTDTLIVDTTSVEDWNTMIGGTVEFK